jgi:formate dehydrogenase alpha subunit
MDVRTDTPALREYRRDLGELMLAESNGGSLADVLRSWGCEGSRYAPYPGSGRSDETHPYLRLDLDACISCRLCLKGCEEIQGQFVYAMEGRGHGTRLTWGEGPFEKTDCVACGACVELCPTGAVTDVDHLGAKPAERIVRTTCSYCGVGCSLDVHVADDRVQRIDGSRESPVNRGHLCGKGRYAHGFSRHPDRLTTPLVRRDGELRPATWEEAIGVVAEAFTRLRGRVAGLSSSRCTNEENYLFQKWMRAGLGTHSVDCCARVCHAPTATGMRRVFGMGAATNSLADIEHADLFLVCGTNTTEAHPVTGARVKQAVLRGAKLIVIDPRRTELAEIADIHLQLRAGTNVPLLNAFARAMIEEGAVDDAFIEERTSGFEAYAPFLEDHTPEALEEITGVPAELVRNAARMYGSAARPMQVHGLGMTEHYQGSESVMLLCNLAMLAGALGREGVGVNPLRGQNNVQGAADMGCQPSLMTGYGDPGDSTVRRRFEGVWGRPLPDDPGLTIPRMYEAAVAGEVKAMFIMGEDVLQSDPASHAEAGLAALELLVVQELFLSRTAERAHVVLPGASFLEKDGTFTNWERRIQRVRRVISPPGDARPDWRILCDLMAATGFPQSFHHPAEIMEEIGRVAPDFAGVTYEALEPNGLQWPVPVTGHPGSAILYQGSFPTGPSGRATFARIEYAPSPVLEHEAAYPLRLITGRVLEHYNCGSMTRRSPNVLLRPADRVELHPAYARAEGLENGDRVRIVSPFGKAETTVQVSERVPAGHAFLSFHFPETGTNDLTSTVLDRLADCPEYKVTPVRIEAAS